ncbi:MAG: hypothetical protein ACFE78_05125 [Candidatus Hodarchaeota archaeon]
MEKPISYFDWKLNFRNNILHKNGITSSETKLNSLNEFKTLLRNFFKKESLLKSGGILSSEFEFQNLDLTNGMITCTIKHPYNQEYQVEINKKGMYIHHKCQEFRNLNKFKKYFCSHIIRLFFILKENDKQKAVELLKHISSHDYNFFPKVK